MTDDIVAAVLRGDARAMARLMREAEDDAPTARARMARLFPHTGRALILGITGPPGAGKSTITDRLIGAFRGRGLGVGVVAVDPSSPYRGGAILGDRLRMLGHAGDAGTFVRSVASRNQLGGLARCTGDMVDILDAAGKDIVIVETVGVGQDGIDIMRLAHVTVVVQVPGLGDDIQALKAGILEISDILVVNKADLDGADRVVRDLRAISTMGPGGGPGMKEPPVILKTCALQGTGIAELADAIERRRLDRDGDARADRDRRLLHHRFRERLTALLLAEADRFLARDPRGGAIIDALGARQTDPDSAARALIAALLDRAPDSP